MHLLEHCTVRCEGVDAALVGAEQALNDFLEDQSLTQSINQSINQSVNLSIDDSLENQAARGGLICQGGLLATAARLSALKH